MSKIDRLLAWFDRIATRVAVVKALAQIQSARRRAARMPDWVVSDGLREAQLKLQSIQKDLERYRSF